MKEKTMGFSRGSSFLELDYKVVPWAMTIDYGCAYAFAPHCHFTKMNPRPNYGLGKLEWGEWLLSLHVLLLRDILIFIMHFWPKYELRTWNEMK
jgi:hypothetical protein